MRSIIYTLAVSLIVFTASTLSFTSCNTQPCKNYKLTRFNVDVSPYLQVRDQTGNGVAGTNVFIKFQKYHCEGPNHWGQTFEDYGTTDWSGWYFYPGTVTMHMDNERDYIRVEYGIVGGQTQTIDYKANNLNASTLFNHSFILN